MMSTWRTQFSLRGVFLVTTTCAVAFWIIALDAPRALEALAACVPVFWFGIGCLIAGDGVQHRAQSSDNAFARWKKALGVTTVLFGAVCATMAVLCGAIAALGAFIAMFVGG